MRKSAKITFGIFLGIAVVGLIVGIILINSGLGTPEKEDSPLFIAGIMFLIVGVGFGIGAPAVALGARNQQKQRDRITAFMKQNAGENAVFLTGTYKKEGDAGKAAAKTAASVAGGILSAAFLGVGVYKIYGSATVVGYIIDDNGLFVFDPNQPLVPGNVAFTPKGRFNECTIKTGSSKVVLTDTVTNEIFTINVTDKAHTPEQIRDKLKTLIEAESPADPAPSTESAVAGEDVFPLS